LKVYEENGLPYQVGDVVRYCLNNWLLMYPDNEIPLDSDYTWTTDDTGLTWKGNCDSAFKTALGTAALTLSLLYVNY